MGKVIAKKFRGMNRLTKGFIVTVVTLLLLVFMYNGWFAPILSDSATNTYRFSVDTVAVNVGVDGSTATALAAGQAVGGKYSLAIPTYTGTNYVTVPVSATTALVTMYGPKYSGDTVLTAPVLRLAQRAGAATGQTTSATVIDHDPVSGTNTTIWSATGALYTATSTGYTNLTFATPTAYTIPHGHRVKIIVSATNNATTAGRLYFYSSATNSSYFTVSENYPTSTTSVANLSDYNGGNITGVNPGQQNVAMLSFQMVTNAASSTVWSGGRLDKIGTNAIADDVTFTIYKDTNNDGSFNPSVDTKISDEVSFSQASGQAYTLVTPQTITTTAQRYFVVYNLSPAAASSTTIGAQILDETYFTVGANNMNPMLSGASSMLSVLSSSTAISKTYQVDFNSGTTFTTPLPATGITASNTSCTTTAVSYSTAVYGLLNYPSHTCTAPAATNYNTLTTAGSITLYFNGPGYANVMDKLQGGTFIFYGATGTSGTASTLKAALFYVTPTGTKVSFPASSTESLSLGTSTTLALKTITFDSAAYNVSAVPRGSRLGMTLTVTGASARLSLNSAAGAKLVMSETAAANTGVSIGDGKVIADTTVTAGLTGKPVNSFTMVAGSAKSVSTLTVSGTNANATNVSAVKIYRDNKPTGGDYGTLGDDDSLIGSGTFSGTSAVVTINEAVGTTLTRYLVVYDIAGTAVVGQKISGLVTSFTGATADIIADTSSAGLTVIASTVVTEGTTEPVTVSVGPGFAAANLDAFGLYTNGPTDAINTITVQLATGTSGAVAQVDIVNRATGAVYGTSTAPISNDTWRLTVSGLSATSTTTQYYVKITPKTTVAGTFYVTGQVSAITHVQTSNALFYNDGTSGTVTIDGIAPLDPLLSVSTGSTPGAINLGWSTVTDTNSNNSAILYKVVRGSANSPAPADCSSGTTVYQGAERELIDATGLTDGHSYTFGYRVCSLDGVGNRSSGSIGSAAAKLPSICNQATTVAFIDSANQYTKVGGSADYRVNIINNDIGDCPPVTYTISLNGTQNVDNFAPATITPSFITLDSNGSGANVKVTVTSLDSAQQGESETLAFMATGNGTNHIASTMSPLTATVNDFGPMLHSSYSVGTKHGVWGNRSTCNDCHINPKESSNNIKLITENVLTPTGRRPVIFGTPSSSTLSLGIFGNEQRTDKTSSTNICEACHHDTKFHQYSAVKQVTSLSHHNGSDCMVCHPHKSGFKYVGGAEDCVSCHGNPPTQRIEMVSPPINALGNNPTDYGAHAKHDAVKMTCDVCHNNYNRIQMGNSAIEMGFAIRSTSYRGFAGNVTNGTITVSSSFNTLYNWVTNSVGTTIVSSPNQSAPSCTVYCHGWQGGGGTNPNPTWVGSYQAACGTCHNVTNATPPSSGSHLKHASSGQFTDNGVTVAGINMSCDKCHGSFSGYSSARHVNGNVAWDLSAIAANAAYKGSVSGTTGGVAPSATFGTCSNLYCHSNIQGTDGTGGPTAYQTPVWGAKATCGSCHVDMYTSAAATGGHKQHAQPSQGFATPFDCRICHGSGGSTNPLNHANGTINMDFSGYGANTDYSAGANVAPGTAFGTCSTSDCHGKRTIAWGASSNLPLCDKCHGSQSSSGGFYATTGPGTAADNTDPIVGAHNAHIHQQNSAFTLYTSYSKAKDCSECHVKPSGPYDAGHIDTALPAEVTFQPGAIANRAVLYGYSGAKQANYNSQNQTCNNVWCHGAAMDSNVGRGAYATVVADGGTLGNPMTPKWNTPFLNGNPIYDCTKCHSYPPSGPTELYTHFSHYSTVGGLDVAILKQPNQCYSCHINVKLDGSGFISGTAHINGETDKGCNACHGVPPNTQAELAIQSNGALASGQPGAHKAHADLPAIGKNCATCHNNYTSTMPSMTMEMGFSAFGGKVTSGAFWGYSTVSNGLTTFVSSSPGTTVYQTNNSTEQNTCAVYCHGLNAAGVATIGGRYGANDKPVWDSGAKMVCGNCHGVNIASSSAYAPYTTTLLARASSAPTTSSHPKHASPSALNLTCDLCHGVITNFNHVNGNVTWNLDTANPKLGVNAVYGTIGKQAAAGSTGNIAPSTTYGSCNNIYCHSSGQGASGTGAPTYTNQVWGAGVLPCNSCHNDMINSGTGSHVVHAQAATCIICHGDGYTSTPGSITVATHVDKTINLASSTGYIKGTSFDPGLGYQTCTNNCHGASSPAWGTSTSLQTCQKCHGYRSSDWNSLAGATGSSDLKVGAHFNHISSTTYKYSHPLSCKDCHSASIALATDSISAAGHYDTAAPAELVFSSLASNNSSAAGGSASYSFTTRACTNVYCHGAGLDSNVSNPPSSRNLTPTWNTPFLVGGASSLVGDGVTTPGSGDCAQCHGYPPMTATHAGKIAVECVSCHPHVNPSGTGFTDASLHINGAVDASGGSCTGCHSKTQAARTNVIQQFTGDSNSHHYQGTATITTTVCYSCHWEANSDGSVNATYHSRSGTAPVNLVVWGASTTRPTTYTLDTTAVEYISGGTAPTSRTQIKKINNHCLGCHNETNRTTATFANDAGTPSQYSPELRLAIPKAATSILSRYSSTRTVAWSLSNYSTASGAVARFGTNNKAKITKALSAHGNATKNQMMSWDSVSGEDIASPSGTNRDYTYSGNNTSRNVLCYDCHNSHGTPAAGITSSYSSATGRYKGGLLKSTTANVGGYAVSYTPASRTVNYKNYSTNLTTAAPFNAGASLCNDCHNNSNPRGATLTKPWSIQSTFSSVGGRSVGGYWSTPYFDNYTANSAKRTAYKAGGPVAGMKDYRKPMGGHFGSSINSAGPGNVAGVGSAAHTGDINGLCTPCHDPHGVSNALGTDRDHGVPLLKGTWVTTPYREDKADKPVIRGGGSRFAGVTAGGSAAGYHIDQNTFMPAQTMVSTGASATATKGDKRSQNFAALLSATNAKTGTNMPSVTNLLAPSNFAGLCLECHNQTTLTGAAAATTSKGWQTKERVHQSVAGWGPTAGAAGTNINNAIHAYTCAKCHAPHVSRLPRLLVTNCLDQRHILQKVSGSIPATAVGTTTPGNIIQSTLTTSAMGAGRFPGGGANYSNSPGSAKNPGGWWFNIAQGGAVTAPVYSTSCHNTANAGGATYDPWTQRWNKKSAW